VWDTVVIANIAGSITLVGGTGVTLNYPPLGDTLLDLGGETTITYLGDNEWDVIYTGVIEVGAAGVSALTPNTAPSIPRYGILNQANNAWLDGCAVTGNDAGFNSDGSANVRTYNCSGSTVSTSSGVFTPYIPT
jgi:hypothetical protein